MNKKSRRSSRRKFIFGFSAAFTSALLPRWMLASPQPAPEIRKLVPPRLDTAYLGERMLCYRPMRKGVPNMTLEPVGDKLVAHNYGHGGSGWTLAPGSAKHVVELALTSEQGRSTKTSDPVIVIGGGVIGLFTAYELVTKGYTNITIMADSFEKLTSHNAGGLLAPVSMSNNPEIQPLIDKIGIDAYRFYAQLAGGELADFSVGAKILPSYFEDRESSGLEPYVGKVMQPAKDVVLDFGNGTRRNMVVYDDGIFIDTAVMMDSLHAALQGRAKFIKQKVEDIARLEASLVFDCSGLGSRRLNDDPEVVPVQGHLIMLKEQVPAELQHMILVYFDSAQNRSNQKVKRSFYIFPKHLPGTGENDVGVIGGTFIEGATPETPNQEEFEILVANARKFYGV
ncbi:MAG: D-amino acid dehydrogenase [Pseudomonadota bacterium]